jgi:hypothetical protein
MSGGSGKRRRDTRAAGQARGSRLRRAAIEALEPRQLLHGDRPMGLESSQLSLSFAPDGTDIAGASSELHALLDEFGVDAWQQTVLRAFQTWAQHVSADVGVRRDGGQPFGTPGARLGDDRFGDIRIGARPLANRVMAISVSQDSVVSGTWAGDVIFNSEADFASLDDLFSVTLHEAGHIFGLEHTDEESSPMHVHGVSDSVQPSAADIALLQELHGPRLPDPWENKAGDGDNDSIAHATEVKVGEVRQEQEGLGPVLLFADIRDTADQDIYEVESPGHATDAFTVRVIVQGVSQLSPRLTLLDQQGVVLQQVQADGDLSSDLSLRVGPSAEKQSLYLMVDSGRDDVFGLGGYSLVITRDDVPAGDARMLEKLALSGLRQLTTGDFEDFFDDDESRLYREDLRSDDEFSTATRIDPRRMHGSSPRYEVIGSVSSPLDRDHYELRAPEDLTTDVMTVAVRALDSGGLSAVAGVYDSMGQRVAWNVLVNGNGEYLLQVPRVQPGSKYQVVVVGTASRGESAASNYQLNVHFESAEVVLETYQTGVLGAEIQVSGLHLSTPQLFHFGLSVAGSGEEIEAGAMVRLRDASGQVVYQVATTTGQFRAAGDFRTSGSVLLMPGTYQMQAIPLRKAGYTAAISYKLAGVVVSDPFGVDPMEPSETDFACPGLVGVYCYPGGIQSADPYLFEEYLGTTIGFTSGLDVDSIVLQDWWNWYWQNEGEGNGPPLGIQDRYDAEAGYQLEVGVDEGVLANDIDPNLDLMTVKLVTPASHGKMQLNPDGSFWYVADQGFSGTDTFQYLVNDGLANSTEVTVSIVVSPNTDIRGDFDHDGMLGVRDLDLLRDAIQGQLPGVYDLNGDGATDLADWHVLVREVIGTNYGDANLDGRFDSSDLVLVFQQGTYEQPPNSDPGETTVPTSWAAGDWNADGQFSTADLIFAFQTGGYGREDDEQA